MSTYVASFERIGRHRDVPDVTISAAGPNDLAKEISDYARPYLASVNFVVAVDSTGVGSIDGGRFGFFTVEPID